MIVRTPDGRTLTVEGEPQPFVAGWAYAVWAYGPDGGYRLNVSPAGSAESVAKKMGDWPRYVVREATWNGGRILSLEEQEQAFTNMLWIGPHHEVATVVNGIGVPLETFMDRLSLFDVRDAADGLTLLPRAGSGQQLGNMLAVNAIDQLCSVQVVPVAQTATYLPNTAGKSVRGGRMWRIDETDQRGRVSSRSALVVNETTATTITAAQPDDPRFIAAVESITCGLG
ncbi:hypothetical protein ACFXJ8_29355 [Nonomuraea sp. NPDC059194]|uniref:hypothetical protein n=1 Tax=Nonomuraea sp. NPDC059194 TaxID=3346764 RepID=UPI0036B2BCAA